MHIGVDIQICRFSQTGLYSYIWNVLQQISRLESYHKVTLFLYGRPGIKEPEQVRWIVESFPNIKLQYVWEDIPLKLLSDYFRANSAEAPRWAKLIDDHALFPLWENIISPRSRITLQLARVARVAHRLRQDSAFSEINVFHHPAGFVFPLHAKANVMTLSDLIPFHFPYYCPGADTWFKESFEQATEMDLILTYSEHTKHDVIESLGIAQDKIHVIPLAAHEQYQPINDQEYLQEVLTRYDLSERPYVLYVGSLEPRKNLCRLVEAFHIIKQQEPALKHQLVLVGTRTWMPEPIFETIRQLRLEDDVKWLGYAPFEDLPALLNGADLFAFPSLYEGFGLPPLEAMSCGTPVVCSHASSLPEVVGDAGLLFDPYQVNNIAEAIQRVLTNSQLHAALRKKGLERARMFSWEKTTRATLAAYEEAWVRFQDKDPHKLTNNDSSRKKTKNYQHARGWVIEQLTRQSRSETNK